MSSRAASTLLPLVGSYFRDHLQRARGASPHTVRSYRDTLRLLFCFIAERRHRPVADIVLDDLQAPDVLAFLSHLESKRSNKAASRNVRLAAIRSFFKHLIQHDLSRADQYERVLAIPGKRAHIPMAQYLEPDEVKRILAQPDQSTESGLRDHALLLLLYNTGARVSEALGIRGEHLSLVHPRHVRLLGKGNKERICPLWRDTASALHRLQVHRNVPPQDWVFCSRKGTCLTRDGVAYILKKYTTEAARTCPSLRRRRVTPHVLRHSCAVALLQAGVDITVIRDYLGHASISTTSRYVSTNLQMKRDALEHFWKRSGLSHGRTRPWAPKPDLLAYLSSI
ncbi:MAG: tyrosine-type recombinase/integrase [Terriglobales bacterium]